MCRLCGLDDGCWPGCPNEPDDYGPSREEIEAIKADLRYERSFDD